MRNSYILAALSLALGASADAYEGVEYGNMFYLGPTTNGQYITKATYSLVPPSPPSDWRKSGEDQTYLAVWIGVQDNPTGVDVLNENFVQPTLVWAPIQSNQGCPADNEHFCAAASTYVAASSGAWQHEQPLFAIPSDATLDYEITVNSTTNKIDQKIYMNGVLTSAQSDSKGMKPAVFYSGNECYEYGCGTLPAYSYTNITLVLNEADTGLGELLALTNATSTGFKTSDGGITWKCEKITIEKDELTQ